MISRATSAVLVAVLCVACGPNDQAKPDSAARPSPEESASRGPSKPPAETAVGSIRVRVTFDGDAPASRPITLPEDWKLRNPDDVSYCASCDGTVNYDESLVVDAATKGLRDVAVSVKDVSAGAHAPLAPLVLDNRCCRFSPHVAFAPVGKAITITNSDRMSHSASVATLAGTPLFNTLIPTRDRAVSGEVIAPGILVVTCPLHDWMKAFIIATNHPHVGVTAANGTVSLDGVPAGKRTLALWHEKLGSATAEVTVIANQTADVTLDSAAFRRR